MVVRKMVDADLPGVRDLYEATFGVAGRELWDRRRAWQFATPAAKLRPAKMLVAETNGDVRGFIAGMPVRVKVGDDIHAILLPCDLAVSPKATGYNLGWRLTRAIVAESGVLACSLAQSSAARKIYDALHWSAIDLAPVAWRPRDFGALAERFVGRRIPLAGWVGSTIDRLAWPRIPSGISIREAERPSDDLDAFWESASKDHAVVGVRDRAFVTWRFFDDPCMRHVFLEARRAGVLVGWTAVTVVRRRGLAVGKIMDLFCRPTDDTAIRGLLRGALETLARNGAAICTTKGLHPAIRARIAPHFPIRRQTRPVRLDWRGDPALAPIVRDARSWHATHADGDEDMSP